MKRKYHKILFSFLFFTGLQQCVFAQTEEGKETVYFEMPRLSGDSLIVGASRTMSYASYGEDTARIKNIITFRINESSSIYFASSFTAKVNFTVDRKTTLGGSIITTYDSLTVNYDKTDGAKYNVRAYIVLPQSQEVKITITAISITGYSGWMPLKVLALENEMRVMRYYTLTNNPTYLVPTFLSDTIKTDALKVIWTWSDSTKNNLTQLEWSWVNTEMLGYYIESGSPNFTKIFHNNSTRVDLDYNQNNFFIPLLYEGSGKLYYRVRAAYRKNDGNIIVGPWSIDSSEVYNGHEPDLNWQSSTSFAEGGKFKSVIQYFDGSLRSRQTVTKDNTTGNTIVGETIYDLQGRPNIQILPTPTLSTAIRYFTNFNRFTGQADSTVDPARFFDLTPWNVKCSRDTSLDINFGNGKYYSANNPWLSSEAKSKFIPDAQGYAFTVTRFMDDATQRVRSQGGVGPDHQINSGHETKYYYGKPSQPELDALFGTEAGFASHYFKNMVQDANGQMSVSYIDMHGRTVATALAGDTTTGISGIVNATDYPMTTDSLVNELLTPATNIIKDNSIESISTILVPATTDYAFTYKLDPGILSMVNCSSQTICFDCKYDLEISIKSEDCGDTTPIIKRYNNLQIVTSDQCSTSMGFVGTGVSIATKQIDFTVSLTKGSWVVRKTLTINDSLFRIRRDSALKDFLCKSQQEIYNSVYTLLLGTSGCGVPTDSLHGCDSCLTKLGTFIQYKPRYLLAIGVDTTSSAFDSTIHRQYSLDSLECASLCGGLNTNLATLLGLRNQMLSDMTPFTGQYAIDSVRNISGIVDLTREEAKYNIFTNQYINGGSTISKDRFYRKPRKDNGDSTYYVTEFNQPDSTIYPNGISDKSFLYGINSMDYTSLFRPSWANNLLYYHPEFTKLRIAETTLKTSYEWLDKVQNCNSYSVAHSLNYDDPLSSDTFMVLYATIAERDTMNNRIIHGVNYASGAYQGPSIWQIANGIVLCATTDSINQYACYMTKDSTNVTSSLSAPDKDKAWENFKTVYLSYRSELVLRYINSRSGVLSAAGMDSLQAEQKQLVFANAACVAAQNGWSSWWGVVTDPADSAGIGTAIGGYLSSFDTTDRCVAQRPFWKAKLLQCEKLITWLNNTTHNDSLRVDTIINKILDSMVMVCRNSLTTQQPYGASNTYPGYGGTPKNFEDIINHVFAHDTILTFPANNYFCNPYSIDFPKPYGKNPPAFTVYTNKLDTCNCSRFTALKLEAYAKSYDTSSFTSMNHFLQTYYSDSLTQIVWDSLRVCAKTIRDFAVIPNFLSCGYQKPCITCEDLNSLTSSFRTIYDGYFEDGPYTDSAATDEQAQKNSLWARYLNYKTGFAKTVTEYLEAYLTCNPVLFLKGSLDDSVILCSFAKPLDDPSDIYPPDTIPCRYVQTQALFIAQLLYEKSKDSLIANFDSLYKAKCLAAKYTEQFYAHYKPKEYHYTLYYYDQAGNLVKTLPPAAVKPNYNATYLANVIAARNADTYLVNSNNNENLATNYRYNTLNQVVAQKTPDAGTSKFWYDRLGRLVVSQNAKQQVVNRYSYTLYDALGRITEVGEKPQATAMTQTISQDTASLASWLNAAGLKTEITHTVYDEGYEPFCDPGSGDNILCQKNLRNRVSFTYVQNREDEGYVWNAATFYSYDIHGNVDTLVQDYKTGMGAVTCIGDTLKDNRFKKMVYNYDLISGKVNDVAYQPGERDQFYHRYSYDAENKLISALTSRDKIYWENDAEYTYYRHGPLSRTVLGQNQVQGVDYAYTIQGWLKGVNSTSGPESGGIIGGGNDCGINTAVENLLVNARLSPYPTQYIARTSIIFDQGFESIGGDLFEAFTDNTLGTCSGTDTIAGGGSGIANNGLFDMGQDGFTDTSGNFVATATNIKTTDAFGFSLNYFNGDYNPISTSVTPFASLSLYLPADPVTGIATGAQLFNGNIAAMAVSIPKISDTKVYGYRYDQLNRIVRMDAFSGLNNATNVFTPTRTNDYHEEVSYDPNGNIRGYKRNGYLASGHLAMDSLNYEYITNSNKLKRVTDSVASGNYAEDIDNQDTANYAYDEIGNLIRDKKEGIDSIRWTVYGKISHIFKGHTIITYTYDAGGNRISKSVDNEETVKTTYYVRDASGNVMSIYQMGESAINSGALSQTELHLYGSSRLGVYNVSVNVQTCDDTPEEITIFKRGNKFFELANHLGNVLVTVSDKRIGITSNDSTVDYYNADVVTANDYYPFGMYMPGRKYNAGSGYRYGFNGKENDLEVASTSTYDYGFRIYSPGLGRFLSVDPLTSKYPELTPYQFASNRPIDGIDIDGKEWFSAKECMINAVLIYDPVLKKITSGAAYVNMENIKYTLASKLIYTYGTSSQRADFESNRDAHLNVEVAELKFTSITSEYKSATLEDSKDDKDVTSFKMTRPVKQQRFVKKANPSAGFNTTETPFSPGSNRLTKANVILSTTVTVATLLSDIYDESFQLPEIQKQALKMQSAYEYINKAISNNKIPNDLLNTDDLTDLANYLISGKIPTIHGVGTQNGKNNDAMLKIGKEILVQISGDEKKSKESLEQSIYSNIYKNGASSDKTHIPKPIPPKQ